MAPGAQTILPVMVGTAGHIDHGKSSLVKALTGIDPDRLKEERERGLTIDIGFARLPLSDGRLLGMIDVPGHERFVRNMVAGSTTLDVALLVVAADDGVMPQTLEHLDILDLLGVRRGVVALTKIDLVDAETATIAEAEVRQLVARSALAGAEVVRVSAVTGEGLDALRQGLERLAVATPPRAHDGPFRLPIQRVFQLKGIGTVVSGVPVSGAVGAGDEVEFLPGGHTARVRAVQAFGGGVDRAVAGHSTALSVPDARTAALRRGHVAAAPGIFRVGDAVDVELRLLARAARVDHRADVRFHTGTVETQGELLLLDRDRVAGGEAAFARIALAEEVCCAPGDRFLLRLQNPPATIGGGAVLRLATSQRRYRRRAVGAELERLRTAGEGPAQRLLEELALAGAAGRTPAELAAAVALDARAVEPLLAAHPQVHYPRRGARAFLREALERGVVEVEQAVARMLRDRPLAASVRRAAFRPSRSLPAELLDAALEELEARGKVAAGTHGRLLFRERLRPLAPSDQRRLDRLVSACEARAYRPATPAELAPALAEDQAAIDELLARAGDEGLVEVVGEQVYGAAALRRALHSIRRNCLAHGDVLDIPALRDELDTTRKFLIPLLEFVDGMGLTRLRGGVRCLLPSSPLGRELEAADGASGAEPS